jgi:hypothetical protein
LADSTVEQLVVLNSDTNIDLAAELPLNSAAPLDGSSQTHEFHMYPAIARSDHIAVNVGSGAQIFLCARRWRDPDAIAPAGPASIPSLALHRPDGQRLAKLEIIDGALDRPDEPLAAKAIAVDPGSYMLHWVDELGNEVEQTVQAVRDWQIQVFLLEQETSTGDDPQLSSVGATGEQISILMGRDRFQPDDETLRLVEQARVALADERNVASSFVSQALFAKFDNPMLGLFGAHLMLIGRDAAGSPEDEKTRSGTAAKRRVAAPVDFDQQLFDHVVGNLIRLLGPDHPDVIALATQASDRPLQNLLPVAVPPMLWRSWRLLIDASNERPDLVPVETWRRTLGVVPTRPFFAWAPEHAADDAIREWGRDVQQTLEGGRATERSIERARDISPGVGAAAGDEAEVSTEVRQRLTTELLAPRSVIDQVAGDQLG